MRYIWRNLGKDESAFTLIELLIVVLVLGILAGIAILSTGPFIARANTACADANAKIELVAAAATEAGVTGDLYAGEPDCSGTPGTPGGGGVADSTEAFTVTGGFTGVSVTANNPSGSFAASTTAGHLLVVAAMKGTGGPATAGAAPGAGFVLKGFLNTGGRAIAIWTATGLAGTQTVQVNWGPDTVIELHRFTRSAGTWANLAHPAFTGTGVGPSAAAELTGNLQGFTGSALVFAAWAGTSTTNATSISLAGSGPGGGGVSGGIFRGSQHRPATLAGLTSALTVNYGGTGAQSVVVIAVR